LEVHHVIVAGYIIWAELVGAVIALRDHPAIADGLRAEVRSASPSGPIVEARLRAMPALARFVLEVKRTTPIMGLISFSKAREDLQLEGKDIPKGWVVALAHEASL